MNKEETGAAISRLVEQSIKNNRKAQMELYRLFAPAMFNASFRILGDRFVSEDIMQESFIVAFEKIKECKTPEYFGAWLKRIVINKSIDEIRKRKNIFQSIDDSIPIADDSDELFSEEDEKEKANLIGIIKRSIDLLPDGYRIVLSLKLIEDYDYASIAKKLDIAESSVRSQFARARQKLIEIIEKIKKDSK